MMSIIDRITKFRLTCDVGKRHFHCGHEYVEIGGIKWATMNIGANSITDNGLYFQWGDAQGYTADQVGRGEGEKCFCWEGYKYNNGDLTMTKYNTQDGKTVLEVSDDAVTAAWGGNWRMPTSKEFKALHNAVNVVWATDYQGSGINGLVCTDKTDSSKVLFFPTAGIAFNGRMYDVGYRGGYWSSSLYSGNIGNAHRLYFDSSYVYWDAINSRFYGYQVRGIVGEIS